MKKLFSRRKKATGADANAGSINDAATSATIPAALAPPSPPMTLPSDILPFVVASELTEAQKRGVAGLCACLLPDVMDGSTDLQWSKMYLRLVIEHFLALAAPSDSNGSDVIAAFLPMLAVRQEDVQQGYNLAEHTNMLDPAPYLALFTPIDAYDTLAETHTSSAASSWMTLFSSSPPPTTQDPLATSTTVTSSDASTPASSSAADVTLAFRLGVVKKLLWFTVKSIGYDARARTLLQRLTHAMAIPWRLITLEEGAIGRALFAEATGMSLDKFAPTLRLRDWKRNAAIGAAALAGGAVLAITGGFAAPAIAGSLLAFGQAGVVVGTAVGTSSGVTATSVLFGAAGAGVVGKKTDTRTRGVQEFAFDLVSDGDGVTVYICIAGWLDKDDPPAASGYRRAFGDSREYLLAFYRVHSPDKIDQLDQVLARYAGREDALFEAMRTSYAITSGSVDNDPLGLLHEELAAEAAAAKTAVLVSDTSDLNSSSSSGSFKATAKRVESKLTLTNFANATASEKLRGWRWRDRVPEGDQYVVVWEEQLLRDFGDEMRSFAIAYAKEKLVGMASDKALVVLKATALAALLSAVALPKTLLDMADVIDNVWVLAMNAADDAGKLLAQALRAREHGLRPVTLVGYSMGARMIVACLKELALTPDTCCGIVENAILLGTPVPVEKSDWASARRIVSGRFINAFSTNDWMLAIMYRYQGWALNCAGIAAIDVDGVENVDLSDLISGHFEYKDKVGAILDVLQLDS